MIDKNLLRLIGENKKYIFYTVGLMVLGLFANGVTRFTPKTVGITDKSVA